LFRLGKLVAVLILEENGYVTNQCSHSGTQGRKSCAWGLVCCAHWVEVLNNLILAFVSASDPLMGQQQSTRTWSLDLHLILDTRFRVGTCTLWNLGVRWGGDPPSHKLLIPWYVLWAKQWGVLHPYTMQVPLWILAHWQQSFGLPFTLGWSGGPMGGNINFPTPG
jgi:hypothetical protein